MKDPMSWIVLGVVVVVAVTLLWVAVKKNRWL